MELVGEHKSMVAHYPDFQQCIKAWWWINRSWL